jgi:hypothetical protein
MRIRLRYAATILLGRALLLSVLCFCTSFSKIAVAIDGPDQQDGFPGWADGSGSGGSGGGGGQSAVCQRCYTYLNTCLSRCVGQPDWRECRGACESIARYCKEAHGC